MRHEATARRTDTDLTIGHVEKPAPDYGVSDAKAIAFKAAETIFYMIAEAIGREELSWQTAPDRRRWRYLLGAQQVIRLVDDLRAGKDPIDVGTRVDLARLLARVRASATGPVRDEAGRILCDEESKNLALVAETVAKAAGQ